MGMINRYKKKGGFVQLLQLLETSPATKREQFLILIRGESVAWEEALRKKILTLNRVMSWEDQYKVEVLSRIQPLTLASVLHGGTPEQIEVHIACLPQMTRRKIQSVLEEINPSPGEKATSAAKILSEVRVFIAQGILPLEKVDPELIIVDNIEENLSMESVAPVSLVKAVSVEPSMTPKKMAAPQAVEAWPSDYKEEMDALKKKVLQLTLEVNDLKKENEALHGKLAQIRKIA